MRCFAVAVFLLASAVLPAAAQSNSASSDEVLRQRLLLRERFNKGWDIQAETPRERERRCKREANRRFAAIHPLKRRAYVKECVTKPRS